MSNGKKDNFNLTDLIEQQDVIIGVIHEKAVNEVDEVKKKTFRN